MRDLPARPLPLSCRCSPSAPTATPWSGSTPSVGEHDADRRIAVCPGSYDPVTNGHLDIITRAARVFDRVVVGVVNQPVRKQQTLFTAEERKAFIQEATADLGNVEVEVMSNLLVEFARSKARRDHQGAAGDLGLRVRVRDEPAQPEARRRHREHVHLRLGQLQLPLFDRASRRSPPSGATSAIWSRPGCKSACGTARRASAPCVGVGRSLQFGVEAQPAAGARARCVSFSDR